MVTVRDNTMAIFYLFDFVHRQSVRLAAAFPARGMLVSGALSRLIGINSHDLSHSFATFLPVSASEILSSILDLLFLL